MAAGRDEGADMVPTTKDSSADATMGGIPPDVRAAMTEELNCKASRTDGLEVAPTRSTTDTLEVTFC